ncbi:hypothetical protein KCMC57_up34490 [Kitasatospora sp. CMC57]|uniref:Integrase n=1 Tax=Kitasatospora sp. CMC57 TaxID=3231513 RepID=A0AB33K5A1_9ACTN
MTATEREPVEPVEYTVAVERYLAAAGGLGPGSRRIYRIALTTWAWPLADRPVPTGRERRRAQPPVLPLALLDSSRCAPRLGQALTRRAAESDVRTLNRELSILRSAVSWWRAQGWIRTDPLAGVRPQALPANGPTPLTAADLQSVFRLRVPLREQVTWRLLYETGATVERVLALDVDHLDLLHRRSRHPADTPSLHWRAGAARLLPLLVVGRADGPLFLTDRRAPARTPSGDLCPYSGRGRLSYRRAAELFTGATRSLDPAGRGWTLRQLRTAAAHDRLVAPTLPDGTSD